MKADGFLSALLNLKLKVFWLTLSNGSSRQQTPDATTLNYCSSSTVCSIVHQVLESQQEHP
jgi:hypothetical protein